MNEYQLAVILANAIAAGAVAVCAAFWWRYMR